MNQNSEKNSSLLKEIEIICQRKSNSNFYYTFLLLPKIKRDALITVYKFCRVTDDIVDLDGSDNRHKSELLNYWRSELEKSIVSKSDVEILNEVASVIKKFNIPIAHFEELISSVKKDIEPIRFQTFDELYSYCYGVASTVGLISIEIFGYKEEKTRAFAINLGIAMQLTNILRDLKSDSEIGRFYLPKDELLQFNYSHEKLLKKTCDDSFNKLIDHQVKRAEKYYISAGEYLKTTDRKNLFSARAMGLIYLKLLKKIKKNKCQVLKTKIKISHMQKIFLTLAVWIKYKVVY